MGDTPLNRVYKLDHPAVTWWPFRHQRRRGSSVLWRLLPVLVHRYAAEFYHSGYGWGYESAFTRHTAQRRYDEMRAWFATHDSGGGGDG